LGPALQADERVLHDILRAGDVVDEQDGHPHQAEPPRCEEAGHVELSGGTASHQRLLAIRGASRAAAANGHRRHVVLDA